MLAQLISFHFPDVFISTHFSPILLQELEDGSPSFQFLNKYGDSSVHDQAEIKYKQLHQFNFRFLNNDTILKKIDIL